MWDAIEANKPADLNTVTDAIYGDVTQDPNRANHYNAVIKVVYGLEAKGYVKKVNANKPFLYVTMTDDDLVSGHATGVTPTITRISRGRGHAPAPVGEVHVVQVEQDEYAQHAPVASSLPRTRARARAEEGPRPGDDDNESAQSVRSAPEIHPGGLSADDLPGPVIDDQPPQRDLR